MRGCLSGHGDEVFGRHTGRRATGLLVWVGGNGLVNRAEQRVDAGYTALLIDTTPLWVAAFLGWLLLQEPVTGRTLAGAPLVLAGVAGIFADR